MEAEKIAVICHEVNRLYCEAIGDFSQRPWEEAEQWQKDSAVQGVQAFISGDAKGPEGQHESWVRAKEADGWVFGPVKDPQKKQHPCMVPYDQLPEEQRKKDALFQAIVKSLI